MRFLFSALAVFAASIAAMPSPATAKDLVLAPSTEWKLREMDDKCRMSRLFGSGEDRTTLWLDQGSLTPAYNLTLIGRPLRAPYGAGLSVQFAPEAEYTRAYLHAKSSKGRPVIMLYGARITPTEADLRLSGKGGSDAAAVDDDAPIEMIQAAHPSLEKVSAITHLRFGRALRRPVVLETGPLSEPLSQLQRCAYRLEQTFKGVYGKDGQGPTPTELERWSAIISNNYPRHMLRAEEEGSIGVALTVGRNGRPSNCEVTAVTGPTSFNDTVCLLMMKHATFDPARDAKGEAVPGRFSLTVSFRLN